MAPQLLWSQTFSFSYETIKVSTSSICYTRCLTVIECTFVRHIFYFFMIFHSLMGTYIDIAMNVVNMFASMAILRSPAGKLLYGALSSVVKVNLQINFHAYHTGT